MAGEEKQAEAKPNTLPEGPKPVEPQKKPDQNPKAEARAEVGSMKEKMETDRKNKQERRDLIKKNAASLRIQEGWVGKKADNGMESMAKPAINSKVDEKFKEYEDMMKQYGLGDETNVSVMKAAAKELVYDYFSKNGTNPITTESYFSGPMKEKMLGLFQGMDKLFKSKKYPYTKAIDMIGAFSEFTGFNFMQNGILNKENLKLTLLQQKSVFDAQLKHFEEYLNLGAEIQKLSGETVNAEKGKPTLDIGKMFSEGKLTLSAEPAILLTSAEQLEKPDQFEVSAGVTIKAALDKKLPANLDEALKQKVYAHLLAEMKKNPLAQGEAVTLKENGTWEKINLAEKQQAQQAAEAQAKTDSAEPAKPEGESENPLDFKTGIPFIDKILEFFSKYFSKMVAGGVGVLAAKTGVNKYIEFMGLNDEEKKSAEELKKVLVGLGANTDTLAILLSDSDETKKILKIAKDKKLNWNEYVAKYLDSKEMDYLKKKQAVPAAQISAMFLSEKTQ
ncbi:hypothetical protein IT413_04795 [Candidatus Peregrinibacteria bacterium]|nr:hypothetical protein [Candidatus Peregrinibacteria bacterium]